MEETEKEVVNNNKQRIIDRLLARHPDLNVEDEEGLYGTIDADYAHYDQNAQRFNESNKKVTDLFNSDARATEFFTRWTGGEDPLIALLEVFGDDFKSALDDPTKLEAFAEASTKHREKILKSAELDQQSAQNLDASFDALDKAQEELGVDDTVITSAYELYNTIINDCIVNKVSKETWILFIKAIMHDTDVEEAEHIGKVGGRNEKIELIKAEKKATLPPQIGGKGGVSNAPKKDTRGFNLPPQSNMFEGAKRRKIN